MLTIETGVTLVSSERVLFNTVSWNKNDIIPGSRWINLRAKNAPTVSFVDLHGPFVLSCRSTVTVKPGNKKCRGVNWNTYNIPHRSYFHRQYVW